MSPYRHAPESTPNTDDAAERCPDGELLPILLVLWVGSVARVALGVAQRERFGAEGALAWLAVLVVPYVMKDAIAWRLRRVFRQLRR